jgi:hypothetical protein
VVLPPLAVSDLVGIADLLSRNYVVVLTLNEHVAPTNLRHSRGIGRPLSRIFSAKHNTLTDKVFLWTPESGFI